MKILQPMPYQGSKRIVAPVILQNFPQTSTRIVEPFAGSAAISISAAMRHQAESYWINDANGPLVDLWRAIIEHPVRISSEYQQLWEEQIGQEREYFNLVRARFNEERNPVDLLYLLARCVKASVRYNSRGEFNNSADHRRRGAHPTEMRRRIVQTSSLLKGKVRITCYDYKHVLARCRNADVIYMDPPYQGVCGDRDQRYMPEFSHEEFRSEIKQLCNRKLLFAISYDGRTGNRRYGAPLPDHLNLTHIEINAGRSTQATLLGRSENTYESLYLSPSLVKTTASRSDQTWPLYLTAS